MSLDGKVTLHSTVSETVKEILEFRENVLKDLPDSLELSTEIDLTTRPGYYFIECSEGAEAELGIDLLTKENMILLVDKILEYIASLTEKITPPTTSVNE